MTHGMGFVPGLGPIALLGQPREGPGQGCCFFEFLPAAVYCDSLGLCRWTLAGLMAPMMGWGVTHQGIIWAPAPAVVSLGSFLGVQMSFVTQPSRYSLVFA